MENGWAIPVVDISPLGLHREKADFNNSQIDKLTEEFKKALEEYGVLYMINHGVKDEKLQNVREVARKFFAMPLDQKMKSYRLQHEIANGYTGKGMEYSSGRDNSTNEGDCKESYNIAVQSMDDFPWPDDATLPGFITINKDFFSDCMALGERLLDLLDLCYPSPQGQKNILKEGHKSWVTPVNTSQGKCLLYQPMSEKEMRMFGRLGEHSDWGTFTLLFQDNTGGLEVRDKHGVAHPAVPLEGAILLQAADMLERWTSGRIKSMPHFVSVSEETRHKTRESTVFFVSPDKDCLIRCIDGSDTYPPCTYIDYQIMKSVNNQLDDEKCAEIVKR